MEIKSKNVSNRVLTGITTTGAPHLGNYVGAIRPAIEASKEKNVDSFFFLADFHAMIKCQIQTWCINQQKKLLQHG
jgi:tryptophanyl-tRNA synthetase